jgi:hypothetical protein
MISRRVLLSCVTGRWGAPVTVCGQIPTHTIVLPPVGLAPTETAPINIMSSAADYPGWSFVMTCQASVTFYGSNGSARGAPTMFSVGKLGQVFPAVSALTGAKGSNTVVRRRRAPQAHEASWKILKPGISLRSEPVSSLRG